VHTKVPLCSSSGGGGGEDGIHGKFAGHGASGEFSFEAGKATVTVIEKPFWLPELLLKNRVTEGLDTLCHRPA
jgi:hypothetical protein